MTYLSTAEVEQVVLPSSRDLGGFSVRRALPAPLRQMVGPFIFLDSFAEIVVTACEPTRMLAFGGEPLPEKRFIRWNFVATDRERIREAACLWRDRRFPGVPGDDAFTPLPKDFF